MAEFETRHSVPIILGILLGLLLASCASAPEVNRPDPVQFEARGPGWHLVIGTDTIVLHQTHAGKKLKDETGDAPWPQASAEGVRYEGEFVELYVVAAYVEDYRTPYAVEIAPRPCLDASGTPWPTTVKVTFGEGRLSGCGGPMPSLAPPPAVP